MKFFKSAWFVLGLTTLVLAPMTTFNILDTFVFAHKYGTIGSEYNIDDGPQDGYDETTVEYINQTRTIEGKEVEYHLLDIKLKSLSNFKSWIARDSSGSYGANITQTIGDMVHSINETTNKKVMGAISGDFTFWPSRKGYVVRNGIIYRTTMRHPNTIDLVVEKNGSVYFRKEGEFQLDGNEGDVSSRYYQIISFGPVLLQNKEIMVAENQEINGNTWVNNPRAAIGFAGWNHIMFLATSAPNRTSKILNSFRLFDLASLLKEKGCTDAYNMDGGYSVGLAYDDEVKFVPENSRAIGDVFYVVPDEE